MATHTLAELEDLLRSPLNALTSTTRLVLERRGKDELGKAHELLPIVEQYAKALEGVIDRVLEHARVEEDRVVLELSLKEVRQIRAACAEPRAPSRPRHLPASQKSRSR